MMVATASHSSGVSRGQFEIDTQLFDDKNAGFFQILRRVDGGRALPGAGARHRR
jgi:hypothetical protein